MYTVVYGEDVTSAACRQSFSYTWYELSLFRIVLGRYVVCETAFVFPCMDQHGLLDLLSAEIVFISALSIDLCTKHRGEAASASAKSVCYRYAITINPSFIALHDFVCALFS